MGASVGVCGYGSGFEWSKCVTGKRKIHLVSISVWTSVLWRSALWTLTKVRVTAEERVPPARYWVSREVQRRRWTSGGEDTHRAGHAALKKRDQSLSKHGREAHPPLGRSRGASPGEPLALLRRAVQCWRWAQQRHNDKWTGVQAIQDLSLGGMSCADGTAMVARRTPERTYGGGKTPKTVCLGGVQNSLFCELANSFDLVRGLGTEKRRESWRRVTLQGCRKVSVSPPSAPVRISSAVREVDIIEISEGIWSGG